MPKKPKIFNKFSKRAKIVLYEGNCLELLQKIPDESIQLIVTSPPYNIGKSYEKKLKLEKYVEEQKSVIDECVRVLSIDGSICWQVGNYVENGSIIPLDTALYPIFNENGLKLKNRIIWHFEHGLHCKNRFSGRYETIVWYTKSDKYKFNLDPVRIPQKYPGKKHFKGPNKGKYSGNPKGKNPGDLWVLPNVKSNHVEKTEHPCQFPVELIERLVLSLTDKGDRVFDPFLGVGTTIISAIRHDRKGLGAEIHSKYIKIAKDRINSELKGTLRTRPMGKPVYNPQKAGNKLIYAPWTDREEDKQPKLLEKKQGNYNI